MKADRGSFQRSILQRRSLMKPSIITDVERSPEHINPSEEVLLTKLKKYNFNLLNKIKNTKNQINIYKDLVKNLSGIPLANQKKMETLIEKNLLPVLI